MLSDSVLTYAKVLDFIGDKKLTTTATPYSVDGRSCFCRSLKALYSEAYTIFGKIYLLRILAKMGFISLRRALLISTSTCSLLFFGLSDRGSAINEYFSGGFPLPSSSESGRIIKHVPENSLGTQQYYSTYVKSGADAWNGITFKVSISSSLSGGYNVRSKVRTGSDPDLMGIMVPYCAAGSLGQCLSSQWTAAEVIGYNNTMDNANFTGTNKLQVWVHEFGHSLSMAHVNDTTAATMYPFVPSNYGIQSRDRQNLIGKWGN